MTFKDYIKEEKDWFVFGVNIDQGDRYSTQIGKFETEEEANEFVDAQDHTNFAEFEVQYFGDYRTGKNSEKIDESKKEWSEKEMDQYKKWKELINMSAKQIQDFMDSENGQKAGLKQSEASKLKIKSGRQSAKWIIKMLNTKRKDWTPEMKRWMGRQISFISRMKGNAGPLKDKDGNPTRKLLALKIWGHNPK